MIFMILYVVMSVLWGIFVARTNSKLYPGESSWRQKAFWGILNAIIAPLSMLVAIIKGVGELRLGREKEEE